MSVLPHDGFGLIMVVFMLGLQHGMDQDHIATIDGLTRFNSELRPRVSRWAGVLFSAGHGIIVTVVAAMVAEQHSRAQAVVHDLSLSEGL